MSPHCLAKVIALLWHLKMVLKELIPPNCLPFPTSQKIGWEKGQNHRSGNSKNQERRVLKGPRGVIFPWGPNFQPLDFYSDLKRHYRPNHSPHGQTKWAQESNLILETLKQRSWRDLCLGGKLYWTTSKVSHILNQLACPHSQVFQAAVIGTGLSEDLSVLVSWNLLHPGPFKTFRGPRHCRIVGSCLQIIFKIKIILTY